MARTRIQDLPKDVEISRAESRAIMGGKLTMEIPEINTTFTFYEDGEERPDPVTSTFEYYTGKVWVWVSEGMSSCVETVENAVAGVRG